MTIYYFFICTISFLCYLIDISVKIYVFLSYNCYISIGKRSEIMYKSFEDAEKDYYGLWYSDNPNQTRAIEIAEYCLKNFTEHKKQIIMDLIVFYGETKNTDKCKMMLRMAFENKTWYPKEFFEKFWDEEIYKDEIRVWNELRDKSLEDSKVIYEIELADNYDNTKEYPLFISLHGWGEDLELFKMFWKSNKLKSEFIHVFVQSSQMVGSYHYCWSDRNIAEKDIKEVISSVRETYKTSDKLLIGGFSEGATTSMDFAFNLKDINPSGFVSLNPDRPKLLTSDKLNSFKNTTIRGSIITGDMDQCFTNQNTLIEDFKSNNIACHFHVTKNFGHWFPDDLPLLIDKSIDFIIK